VERQCGAVTGVYSCGNALVARNGEVVLPDGLGTTRATVDGVQAITSTLTTEAFGNAVAQWGSSANPYRFAGAWGYRDDGDAGLLYIGARYYDLAVGRWTSADKWLGNLYRPLSLNRYLCCEDDPVNHVDPSGRVYVDISITVSVGIFQIGIGFQFGNTAPGEPYEWHFYVGGGIGIGPPISGSFTSSWDYITPGPFLGGSGYFPLPILPVGPGGR
jgi:RHS repeat-associated protein